MKDELFKKKETIKPMNEVRRLSDKQWLAIKRDRVIKYFCEQWKAKYGNAYLVPPNSFMSIDKPIADALAHGYTQEQLTEAIDCYLQNEFVGYVENSHPFKFFTKDISRWCMTQKRVFKQKDTKAEVDVIRELNEKYGILKKGDSWIDEDGKVYITKEDAIRAVENRSKR